MTAKKSSFDISAIPENFKKILLENNRPCIRVYNVEQEVKVSKRLPERNDDYPSKRVHTTVSARQPDLAHKV